MEWIRNKIFNRILIAALLLTIAVMSLCSNAVEAATQETEMVTYTEGITGGAIYFDKESGEIKSSDKSVTKVVIPDSIDGVEVKNIGRSAFSDCERLVSVEIAGELDACADSAFIGCTSLSEVTIQKGLRTIGDSVFSGCVKLEKIYLPDGLLSLGDFAFGGCSSIESIVLPDSVRSIGANVFGGCEKVKTIKLSSAITYIDEGTFRNCNSLEKIAIPASVVNINMCNTFASCESLKEITVEQDSRNFSSEDGVLFNEDKSELIKYPAGHSGVSYDVPDSVKTIGLQAFGDSRLSEITIKSNVIEILGDAFTGCKNFSIRGENGSYAESYAKANDIPFVSIDNTDIDQTVKENRERIFMASDTVRAAGLNRYTTALAAADTLKQSMGSGLFENVIIACGNNYPDALAGSYLAKVKKAPILLASDAQTSEIKAYIEKNMKKGGTVYLLGGTGAISEKFEGSLSGMKVKRLGGQTRYETNIAILSEAGVKAEDLLVCTGDGFADSLSASAAGRPILLVDRAGLSDMQKNYLKDLEIKDVYLIGGTGVVSEYTETQMNVYDNDGRCERLSGQNRYQTSVAVAKKFFLKNNDVAVLACGFEFPDGLAGGPVAMAIGAPVILVDKNECKTAAGYVKSAGVDKMIVIGGDGAISETTVNAVRR